MIQVINYQTRRVDATAATFNGVTGDNMTNAERAAEQAKIYDHNNLKSLGLVKFYYQAKNLIPKDGSTKHNAGTLVWSKVKGAVSYDYESSNVGNINPDNSLQGIIYTANVPSNSIDASGTAPGIYYWQVRPVFADSSVGVWSNPTSITVK